MESVAVAWSSGGAGSITPDGVFTSAERAGTYNRAVNVSVSHRGQSLQQSIDVVDVVIEPGPVSQITAIPNTASIFTGDSTTIQINAADAYSNAIEEFSTAWQASTGTIYATGQFTAGRAAGTAQITATVTANGGVASSNASVQISKGYCDTTTREAEWQARWSARASDGSHGALLSTSTLPATFDYDWAYGAVAGGRSDAVYLEATMNIIVQRHGPVAFTVGGDDGYRLRLDGELIISDWTNHSFGAQSKLINLKPGVYELELEYYESGGEARLTFGTDADVITWTQATQCFGGYSEPPDERFFLTESDSDLNLAQRFDVVPVELNASGVEATDMAMLPGMRQPEGKRKTIFLLGIDSSGSCQSASALDGGVPHRLELVRNAAQAGYFAETGLRSALEYGDFIGFSYSGLYQGCDGSNSLFSADSYPVDDLTANVTPVYGSIDTCLGVAAAANNLNALVIRVLSETPDARITFIGHSMGGMTAAYYMAELATQRELEQIDGLMAIDSPLRSWDVRSPTSDCGSSSQAWQDIYGHSHVVDSIASLANSPLARDIYEINSTDVGDVIPSSNNRWADCASGGGWGLLGAIIGALINPFSALVGLFGGSYVGDLATGHSCAFGHTPSLEHMGMFANGQELTGFQRISASIDPESIGPSSVIEASQTPVQARITNTGNTTWTYYVQYKTRRMDGRVTFAEWTSVKLEPDQSALIVLPANWGEPGARDIQVTVYQRADNFGSYIYDPELIEPLADTGWILSAVTVVPVAQPTPTPIPIATPTATASPTTEPTATETLPLTSELRWLNADGDSISTVERGTIVTMEARSAGYKDGTVSIDILEIDPGSLDDYVTTVQMTFSNGIGTAQWTTVWTSDGLFGLGGDPEYKFVVDGVDSPQLVVT